MTAKRLTEKELLEIFRNSGALLEGHFLLSSGLHSDRYIQCALVLQYPDLAAKLGAELARWFQDLPVDVVIGPALGGILVAYEVARALNVRAIFAEREDGVMTLRRGFSVNPGERVLVVEDVVTTGGSTREVIEVVQKAGAQLIGVGALVDRHTGTLDFGVPFHSLLRLEIATYSPESCPLCEKGKPLVKPGSRSSPSGLR
ncbi:MAG: Orotate phosphoribosyltransferase [Thermoanaerobacterales bacterium 50_218]|nr:MAG: Orotate phosphoribosyltransferase [Thermoanaerobacterales bacterium 50_218]